LVADYYSRFVEVKRLMSTTFSSIIAHLKEMFSQLGIPAILINDKRPQFDSLEMKQLPSCMNSNTQQQALIALKLMD